MEKKLSEIAQYIGGVLEGEDLVVNGIGGAAEAADTFITFMESDKYKSLVASSKASSVIVPLKSVGFSDKPFIRVANPRLAFAKLLELFYMREPLAPSIHPTAVIGDGTEIGEDVYIGPYVVIGKNVRIGKGAKLLSFVFVDDEVSIGENSLLNPRVTIMYRCRVGARVIINPGAVIGGDGFGFVRDGGTQVKIPQVGIVEIGDDVEIGSNTTIDRATTDKTVIGKGTKMDNLVQIGHNTIIGSDCTIVSQSGIAGSVIVGERVIVAAQAGLKDHIEIGSNSVVCAQAGVSKSVKPNSIISGYPAKDHREELRIEAAINVLPDLVKKVERMSKQLGEIAKLIDD